MAEKLVKVETDVEYIREKLDKFIESADTKYAPRWVVTILAWIAGICAIVISAGCIKLLW